MSPRRAMRPCAEPGCPRLSNATRCAEHAAKYQTRTRAKSPAQKIFYSSAKWRALREMVLPEEPMCRLCGKARSTTVDHIDGRWQNNARANLRGLCSPCERSRTGRQHREKRRP